MSAMKKFITCHVTYLLFYASINVDYLCYENIFILKKYIHIKKTRIFANS